MAIEEFDQRHRRIARRHGAALIFLEGAPAAADQPAGFFLGQLEPLTDLANMGSVGGFQFLKHAVGLGQVGAGMDERVLRDPQRRLAEFCARWADGARPDLGPAAGELTRVARYWRRDKRDHAHARELALIKETLLLFVRVWFEYAGPLDDSDPDAGADAEVRLQGFLEMLAEQGTR